MQDYPDTLAGKMYEDFAAATLREQHSRRPPGTVCSAERRLSPPVAAKRVNFAKHRVDYPFGPGWNALLELDARGDAVRRWDGAVVEARPPEQSQVSVARGASAATGSACELVFVSVRLLRGTAEANAMLCAPAAADLDAWRAAGRAWAECEVAEKTLRGAHAATPRRIIGFATFGMQSFVRGRGFAVGFCRSDLLAALNTTLEVCASRDPVVLVRNTTSLAYQPAFLSVRVQK